MVNNPQINLMSNHSKKKMKKSRGKDVQKGQKIRKKIYSMIRLHTNQIFTPYLRSSSSIDHLNKSTKDWIKIITNLSNKWLKYKTIIRIYKEKEQGVGQKEWKIKKIKFKKMIVNKIWVLSLYLKDSQWNRCRNVVQNVVSAKIKSYFYKENFEIFLFWKILLKILEFKILLI